MHFLLTCSSLIDKLNRTVGRSVAWLTLIVVLVSAINAIVRKTFNVSSNAWLELQWYLFGAIFLLASGYTFLRNEHVRVDVISQNFSRRVQIYIEIFGVLFFLLPAFGLVFWLSIPYFYKSLVTWELSSNTGGLIRWPVKLLIPLGFGLLLLSGVSHLIKCIGFLMGIAPDPIAEAEQRQRSELEIADDIAQYAQAVTEQQTTEQQKK
ncbi:MAG TPA: TRAP transporter small permease subunit [Paenalcaligenes sp.]|nr:TRAP transporter small permease subunit [Paenalcaligenes sp.]